MHQRIKHVFLEGILPSEVKAMQEDRSPWPGRLCTACRKTESNQLLDLTKVATCLLLPSDTVEHCVLNICLGFTSANTSMIAFDMAADPDPDAPCLEQCLMMMRMMVANNQRDAAEQSGDAAYQQSAWCSAATGRQSHERSLTVCRSPCMADPTKALMDAALQICNWQATHLESKPAKQRAKAPASSAQCLDCGTTSTSQWRTGPSGPKSLCNACGIRLQRNQLKPEI